MRNAVFCKLLIYRLCKCIVYNVEISDSARRHGITDEEIAHAYVHAIRLVEFEYDGDEQLLVIGADQHGRMLEIVAVPADEPVRIIHADRLRPKLYKYLK